MALSQTIWSLDGKRSLEMANLNDEKELELLLCSHIELLNKSWMVVGNQVKTEAGKFIDILCIDHDGDMVVVELKKDMTPREVTAQVIDYAASVSKMTVEEIAKTYLTFSNGQTLNEAFQNKFNATLDESNINNKVKMVIVAAKMDDGTERIIRFLRETYEVDINILFFQIFQHNGERLISRAWLEEDIEEILLSETAKKSAWNGEYYVNFGVGGDTRDWEDARKYGFISAGGGSFYSKTLFLLSPGDRVWVNLPHFGFTGVGIVTESACLAREAVFDAQGQPVKMNQLSMKGLYFYAEGDSENAEYVVKVDWLKTVPASKAVHELGFFGNQNTVCRPKDEKWVFTVNRLKKCWNIEE